MVSNDPRQLWHFELELLLCLIPLQIHIPLAVELGLFEGKAKGDSQLLGRGIEESLALDLAFRFIIVHAFLGLYLGLSHKIVSESMRQLCEVLSVETDIEHVERVLVVEVRDIGDLAANGLVLIGALSAQPVFVVLHPSLLLSLLALVLAELTVFEANSDVLNVVDDCRRNGHVQFHDAAA